VVALRMGEVDKLVLRKVVAPGMGELGTGDGGSGRAGDGEVDAPVRREGSDGDRGGRRGGRWLRRSGGEGGGRRR